MTYLLKLLLHSSDLHLKRDKNTNGDEKTSQLPKRKQMKVKTYDSDDDCPSGYWLRVPTERMESTHREQFTQCNPTQNPDSDVSEQEGKESHTEPEYIPDPAPLPTESQTEQGDSGNRHDLPSTEEEDRVNEHSDPDTESSLLTPPLNIPRQHLESLHVSGNQNNSSHMKHLVNRQCSHMLMLTL